MFKNNIIFDMYCHSDILIKLIIICLLLISSMTWAFFFSKYLFLMYSRRLLYRDLCILKTSFNLEDAVSKLIIRDCLLDTPLLHFLGDIVVELYISFYENNCVYTVSSVNDRVLICLERRAVNIENFVERGSLLFSTVASVAPFIGLFGTIWSIIKYFINFQIVSLTLLSSGISEALVLTGLGLFVAIPAIIIHSILLRIIIFYEDMINDCVSFLMLLVRRDLDIGVRVSNRILLEAYQRYEQYVNG